MTAAIEPSRTAFLYRRHRLVDCFSSLLPVNPQVNVRRIFESLAVSSSKSTHIPLIIEEYRCVAGGEIFRNSEAVRISPPSVVVWHGHFAEENRL